MKWPRQALSRTAESCCGWNRRTSWPSSLSLGRYAIGTLPLLEWTGSQIATAFVRDRVAGSEALALPTFLSSSMVASEGEEEFVEAAPEGDPAGFAVAFAAQVTTESGEFADEIANGDDRASPQSPQHVEPFAGDAGFRGFVGAFAGGVFQLHQPDGDHTQQPGNGF